MITEAALLAGGAALAVGIVGVVAVLAVARRSVAAAAIVAPLVVVAAVAGGVLVTARAMFISEHDQGVVLIVIATALPIAALFGLIIARQVSRISRRAADERAAREREIEVEAGRRELVAWVSHDLRTPLAGIRAMAEAIEDGMAPADGSYAARIRREADRMAEMVSGLLSLSRLHSGTLRLDRTPMDLRDLVSDALASARVLAERRGVEVSGTAPEAVLAEVDPRELSRALSNLVTNAVTHTPSGGHVGVSLSRTGPQATIAVTDECGGIPGEHLDRLFEPGWRGTSSRTPAEGEGAGLGLAVAQGIARAHGGDVGVTNLDGGCRFELSVPVRAAGAAVTTTELQAPERGRVREPRPFTPPG